MTITRRSLMVLGVLAAVALAASTGVAQAQPVAPLTVSVNPQGYGALVVSWTTHANHQAGDTYDVRYEEVASGGVFPGVADKIETGNAGLTYTITGLKHDTRYIVNVRGRRGTVTSAWRDGDSDADTFDGVGGSTIAAPPLGKVRGVKAEARNRGVMVTWNALADATGAPLGRYNWRAQSPANNVDGYVDGDELEAMIPGLTNGVEYTVSVRAQGSLAGAPDRDRFGPYSDGVKVTPMADAGEVDDEDDDEEEPTPTPAVPLAGVLALFAGLLAAARARLRR